MLEYFHEPFPCIHPLTCCGCTNNKNARIHTILMKRSPFLKKCFRSDTLVESGKKRTSEEENETSRLYMCIIVRRYLCSFLTILILIIRSQINYVTTIEFYSSWLSSLAKAFANTFKNVLLLHRVSYYRILNFIDIQVPRLDYHNYNGSIWEWRYTWTEITEYFSEKNPAKCTGYLRTMAYMLFRVCVHARATPFRWNTSRSVADLLSKPSQGCCIRLGGTTAAQWLRNSSPPRMRNSSSDFRWSRAMARKFHEHDGTTIH